MTDEGGLCLALRAAARDPNVLRLQALSSERFPKLREIVGATALTNFDREFHAGLDILLKGLGSSRTEERMRTE